MAVIETGNSTAGMVDVDSNNNLQVNVPGFDAGGVERGGGYNNAPAMFSENDTGETTGERENRSPETDDDYRLRVGHDNMLDQEAFTDSAQNTGKYSHNFTTLTATMSASGLLTNSGGIITTATGMTFGTHAMFPVGGTQTLVCETAISFSAQPASNVVIDFGMFLRGASTAFAPTDGVYFRLSSAGLQGVINFGGVETTTTAVFPESLGSGVWTYTNDTTHAYLIQVSSVRTTFWIDNVRVGTIPTPLGQDNPCLSRAVPWSIRHANVGAAGAVMQSRVRGYRVFLRGSQYSEPLSVAGSRAWGSYQGLSGGTMGSLATLPNSANPTAVAAPTNTTLAAGLPAGLGGHGLVAALAGAATDFILGEYGVPAGTTAVQGRRLVIRGVVLDALNTGAAVATTATAIEWKLAFGHTAVSMATAETASFANATTKAPRRIFLGFTSWAVGSAIGSQSQGGRIYIDLADAPIFVNPGERVALLGKFIVGTATVSQTIWYNWQPIYGWE